MKHISQPNRILDPIHGLIQFSGSEFDCLVLALLDSDVMQRLRRIQQLGLTSLVYPAATHSRFSHSIGVFAVARKILDKINRSGAPIGIVSAERTLLLALLHDIGHGPYSHVFERVEAHSDFHHETMGYRLLQHPEVKEIFAQAGRMSDWQALQPAYAGEDAPITSLVSGTFDADRLDYLPRDQVLSGSFQGRFDWPWLLDNLEWDGDGLRMVLNQRSIHAAEEYLLARSHLYQTVYYHRTVRGAEGMLAYLLRRFALHCREGTLDKIADIPQDFPLRKWFSQSKADDTDVYLSLDDSQVQMLLWLLRDSGDTVLRRYAALQQRHLFHCLEPSSLEQPKFLEWLENSDSEAREQEWGIHIEHLPFVAYERQQPIMIRMDGGYHELSSVSLVAKALTRPIHLLRIYADDVAVLQRLSQHVLAR